MAECPGLSLARHGEKVRTCFDSAKLVGVCLCVQPWHQWTRARYGVKTSNHWILVLND